MYTTFLKLALLTHTVTVASVKYYLTLQSTTVSITHFLVIVRKYEISIKLLSVI